MSGFVVGIDAGGTSLRVRLQQPPASQPLASLTLPAAADGGPEPLEEALRAVLAAHGLTPHDCFGVCAGITKVSRAGVQARWEQALAAGFPQARVQVVPDFVVAFHGAIPTGMGVLLIAGTGSVAYGENAQGRTARVGGRGWEFGDEGSGAHLTEDLVRRTVRACDGIYPPTPLTRAVCDWLGSDDAGVVAERARQCATEEGRGFLVPLTLARAHMADKEAKDLFVGEAGWLARLTRTTCHRLGLGSQEPIPIATVGGLWEAGEFLRVPFVETLCRWLPNAVLTTPLMSPVEGAVRLASR